MTRIMGDPSRWLLAVGGFVVAAAAVGCQSSPDHRPAPAERAPAVVQDSPSLSPSHPVDRPPASPVGRTPVTRTPRPDPWKPRRCHTDDLAVKVGQSDSATGHTGLNLALVNRSTHPCRIYGYGGVQLLDAAGAALPTQQLRGWPTPQLITLRPGQRAHSLLTWVSSPDAPPCSGSTFLLVTPPDETEPIRVAFSHTVCGNGRLSQGAYQTTPI
jgi:Domain of unknown function (DUF4232)